MALYVNSIESMFSFKIQNSLQLVIECIVVVFMPLLFEEALPQKSIQIHCE